MPTYVVLSKFTDQGRKEIKSTVERLDALRPLADQAGVKVIANVITMGEFDVVTVLEAANDETLAKMVGALLQRGYVTTQSMRGFTLDEFRQVTASLG
jgi:uncharacterized protein with GYD domain